MEASSGTIGATGRFPSAGVNLKGYFVARLSSGTCTGQLERSTDNGVTWFPVSRDSAGTLASYSVTSSAPVVITCFEPEAQVLYSWNVTAFTSSSAYRFGEQDKPL